MKNLAPYQLFFPLGALNAIVAVSVWFVQNLGWFSTPALFIHSKLVMGGFLWCFIVGFLMTAIPRMTGTASASIFERGLAAGLLLAQSGLAWMMSPRPFYAASIATIGFLLIFGGRRIVRSQKTIPVFFSHVGLAMLLALGGAIAHHRGESFLGIHLYHLGAVLLLVLGIGTRFFAFLSGLPSTFETEASIGKRMAFHGAGILSALMLFTAGTGRPWAYLVLFGLSLFYLLVIWRWQRSSDRPSALKWGMRLTGGSIPIGFLMSWLQPELYLSWLHLIFVGAFAMVTYSVATRVTLAHGAYPLEEELRSRALNWMIVLLLAAALSRIGYGYSTGLWRTSWLHLAGTFWVAGVCVWIRFAFVRIFVPGPQAKPSC